LGGNITFTDSDGKAVSPSVDFNAYAKGMISFTPVSKLTVGKTYIVKIGENIGDVEGVKLQENLEVVFTVEETEYNNGEVIDDFETAGNWQTPQNSGSTEIDETTNFEISSSKKLNGSFAGKMNYSFNGNEGYYKISRVNSVAVGSNSESMFGIWIYGELSGNILEFWFKDSENNLFSKEIDTLNFTGWKMKDVKLSDISTGNLAFEGIGIKQIKSASTSGTIYIDDAQYDFATPVENEVNNIPTKYSLEQNYPNPFNPSTVIKYSIPTDVRGEMQEVRLTVYDILGNEVATLVNENQKAGNYQVTFNAKNLSSGIYFYRLQSGNFVESKKMMLIK
jgi:hypothetical protein